MVGDSVSICVIIATYDKPDYLRIVLEQMLRQSHIPDQVIVADDGSGPRTLDVIDAFSERFPNILHVRHKDNGFRKCEIANKSLAQCQSDYVIFTDDDCLAPPWFVASHLAVAKQGVFTVGASVNLAKGITQQLLRGEMEVVDFLALGTLEKMKLAETLSRGGWAKLFLRTLLNGTRAGYFMDRIYMGRGIFRGGNSGAWRSDLLKVNGFNNDMVYGHEDREIGERLCNLGLKCRQVRYLAANFHLEHARSYVDHEKKTKQRQIYRKARKERITACQNGLRQVS